MRRMATLGAMAVLGLAGCGGSSEEKGSAAAYERAVSVQRQAAERRAAELRSVRAREQRRALVTEAARRRAVERLRKRQAQTQPSTGGAAAPSSPAPSSGITDGLSGGAAPSVDSPEGKRQLKTDPDCAGHPPPPPAYHGPVQC